MADIKRCVTSYTTGYAELKAHFPNGEVCCDYCPGCNKNDGRVFRCMWLGGQAFASADAKIGILVNCPIKFD